MSRPFRTFLVYFICPKFTCSLTKYLTPILLLFSLSTFAQNISYYKNVADTTKNKLLKLVAMDSVISKSFGKDTDTFILYSQDYITLAKELDSIESAARKAMSLQYILTNYKNESRSAVTIINSILAEKYQIKDSFLLGGLYLKRGGAHFSLDLKKAIEDYTLAIENFGQKDSIYVADAYLFRGQAYSDSGEFVPAGENYDQAYSYFEALKDYEYMAHAQQGNIIMFSRNGFYEKAKEERNKLINKLKELGLKDFIITELYNQALDYRNQDEEELTLDFLTRAKNKISPETEGTTIHLNILSALVSEYSELNKRKLATENLDLLESYLKEIEAKEYTNISYYNAKAKYLNSFGDREDALQFAKKKLEAAKSLHYNEEVMDAYLLLSQIQENLGDYKSSLANKKLYLAKKDSLFNVSSANSLAYYQTLYETEKKENELIAKNTNIQLLEKDKDAYRKFVVFSSIALLLTFGLILLYRNQLHLEKKKTLQEKFSQELLASQENERKRISKDLHDGLGQQLLVIKNNLITSGNTEAKKMIDVTIEEVRTISRDLHPFHLQELGITKAIEHTITQIDENTSLFISSEIENIDDLFTKDQEVNIYRIVQESLSNTLKHANAEASKVSVKKMADQVIISIRDNGEGFEFNEKLKNIKSLGLKALLERTNLLNGQMKVQSKKQHGTLLEFQFPF
jgi:signal transduction histidine kinase